MTLYVLIKDGKPFELPAEQGTETANMLSMSKFATASTDRGAVEVARQALPMLLDLDDGPEVFTIAEYRPLH